MPSSSSSLDKRAASLEEKGEDESSNQSSPPVYKPCYWDDYQIHCQTLSLFRTAFFLWCAVNFWQQIYRAPLYSSVLFPISHFPFEFEHFLQQLLPSDLFSQLFLPSPRALCAIWIVSMLFCLRAAFGHARAWEVWLVTTLTGYTYFVSQLNLYQHEYLLFLVLLICSTVDWDKAAQRPLKTGCFVVKSWQMRLLVVQVR